MKKNKALLVLLLASAAVWACTDVGIHHLDVGAINSSDELAAELQKRYGDQFGRDVRMEGYVTYSVSAFGVRMGLHSLPIVKECDKTLEQVVTEAQQSWRANPGFGGGPVYRFPGFPYIPGGCIGNCGTVEVGEVAPV